MKHLFLYKALFVWLLMFLLSGCVNEEDDITMNITKNDEVSIAVTVPELQLPTTRAMTANEAKITTCDLLLFDSNGTIISHIKVASTNIIKGTDGDYTFKFNCAHNPNVVTIAIVANAEAEVTTAINGNTTKTTILNNLIYTQTGKWGAGTPIPMYGEVTGLNGITGGDVLGSTSSRCSLKRMLARVDVTSTAADFTINKITVANSNNRGYIAPLSSLPGSQAPFDLVYGQSSLLAEAYICEAAAPTGVTSDVCLIVEGTYKGKTYFYRIDFTACEKDGSGKIKDGYGNLEGDPAFDPSSIPYMAVKRNHLYNFRITNVEPGYATYTDAINSLGIRNNLKVELHVIDMNDMQHIIYSAGDVLAVGKNSSDQSNGLWVGDTFCIYDEPGDIKLSVKSNYYTKKWTAKQDAASTSWLELKTASGTTDTPLEFSFPRLTADSNEKTQKREATITITSGRLTLVFKILQTSYMYVGYFGGELKKSAAGVWKYEKKVYVQPNDEAKNLLLSDNGACSNRRTHSDYAWFTPAIHQLIGIWCVTNSFPQDASFPNVSSLPNDNRLHYFSYLSTSMRYNVNGILKPLVQYFGNVHKLTNNSNSEGGGDVALYNDSKTFHNAVRCVIEK
ncbi:fimbrial protein [Bacteroides sp. 519]|uniref:fimbrial protein n=1 Tax=Bacteroides sp. 519 TaxID=2302937 RepID=UPI0013D87ACD|nr:fimbrial protein [Bacteroides sp. 519]NDV56901.1 hypothetical protein [Bacteroides sp. 519]